MGKFVLDALAERGYIYEDGYYTGKSYIVQGARYAVVNKDINTAKVYSSKKRAEKACEMEFANYRFTVKEI